MAAIIISKLDIIDDIKGEISKYFKCDVCKGIGMLVKIDDRYCCGCLPKWVFKFNPNLIRDPDAISEKQNEWQYIGAFRGSAILQSMLFENKIPISIEYQDYRTKWLHITMDFTGKTRTQKRIMIRAFSDMMMIAYERQWMLEASRPYYDDEDEEFED